MPSDSRDQPEEPPITAAQIRQRAYDLWERNHRPEGMEMQFWLVAERELRAERARRAREDRSPKAADPPAAPTDRDPD